MYCKTHPNTECFILFDENDNKIDYCPACYTKAKTPKNHLTEWFRFITEEEMQILTEGKRAIPFLMNGG